MASKAVISAWSPTSITTIQALSPRISQTAVRSLRHAHNVIIRKGLIPPRRHASTQAPKQPTKAAKPRPYQPRPQASSNNAAPEDKKLPVSQLVRDRWFAMLGFGTAVLCIGYITASTVMYWRRTSQCAETAGCYPLGCEPVVPTGRPSIQSPYEFDLHLDKSEHRYGITKLRNELASAARGHVLEVAVGTGRNFEFYNWTNLAESLVTKLEDKEKADKTLKRLQRKQKEKGKELDADDNVVLSFTGIDISPGMLDIALRRLRSVVPNMPSQIPKKASFAILAANANASANTDKPSPSSSSSTPEGSHTVSLASDQIRMIQSDVQSGLPSPPSLSPSPSSSSSPPQFHFDTILQSFGLCSVRDPVSLVVQMASAVKPDTGRILLLEHGRSSFDLVNSLLDRSAGEHHSRFGCWWNRDIEAIVAEAALKVPGLEIVRLERPGWWTGGTHFVVELRVRGAVDGKVVKELGEVKKESSWFSWRK
ncbi:hypothetical protein F5Y16DRAFT_100333 [Xylariaceae sp. FL0255]|nr:hypothetical protein F5Y16DRAFT_100333 [Xylariaceae sp. FL0255]